MKRRDIVFVADNIRSLENVGSLFRITDGIGAKAVWSIGISGYPDLLERDTRREWLKARNTKFIQKSGLSGLDNIAADYFEKAADAILKLKEEGRQIICVEQTENSVDFKSKYLISEKCCIVLGNEIEGVSKDFLDACDLILEIPMNGVGKSLNVAVSAGIIGYEIAGRI